jgi:hypothetical protein
MIVHKMYLRDRGLSEGFLFMSVYMYTYRMALTMTKSGVLPFILLYLGVTREPGRKFYKGSHVFHTRRFPVLEDTITGNKLSLPQ